MPPARVRDVWLPLLVVHAAMMVGIIAYGVMGYVVAEEASGPPPAIDHATFLAAMAGVAAVAALLSFVVRARMMPPRERAGDGRGVDVARLGSTDVRAAFGRLRGALIGAWGLSEAVAVCGLVSTVLFHAASPNAPVGAAALILLLVHAPRPRLLVQVMAAVPHD